MNRKDEIIEKILKPVGKPVSFSFPNGEGDKVGVLKDRSIYFEEVQQNSVPYWDVVDLITFEDQPEKFWIRLDLVIIECRKIGWYGVVRLPFVNH